MSDKLLIIALRFDKARVANIDADVLIEEYLMSNIMIAMKFLVQIGDE